MDTKGLIEQITSPITSRPDIFELAWDRGRGEGMLIEKWMLVEMTARLIAIKRRGELNHVEADHRYPLMRGGRFEQCDLWWVDGEDEHFLELKTIVLPKDQMRWKGEIGADLGKALRLRSRDRLHHLAVAFPLSPLKVDPILNDLRWDYEQSGLTPEGHWEHPLDEGHSLVLALFSRTGPLKSTTKSRLEVFLGSDD